MHTNFRRKRRNSFKNERGVLNRGFKRLEARLVHKSERQKVRKLIHHRRYDDILFKYYDNIRWNYF